MFIVDSSSLDLPEHCFSANRLHSCGRISRHCAKRTLCQGVPMQSCLKRFCDDGHEETSFQNFSVLKYVTAKLPGLTLEDRTNINYVVMNQISFLLHEDRHPGTVVCGGSPTTETCLRYLRNQHIPNQNFPLKLWLLNFILELPSDAAGSIVHCHTHLIPQHSLCSEPFYKRQTLGF